MKYLIDTCVISELRRPSPAASVLSWFDTCDESKIFISSLSIGELHHGISRLPDGKRKNDLLTWFNQITEAFSGRILPITDKTSIIWADMRTKAESNGTQLPVIDGLLAATAQENELIFVTRNTKDFAITGVIMHNPWIE
jgi:toxin FitB